MSYTRTFTADEIRLIRQTLAQRSRDLTLQTRRLVGSDIAAIDAAEPTIKRIDDLLDWLPDPDSPEVVTLGGPGGRIHDPREAAYDEFG